MGRWPVIIEEFLPAVSQKLLLREKLLSVMKK